MFSPFTLSAKYFRYLLNASNSKGHGIHSPFVFDFVTKVLNDRSVYPAYGEVEKLRNKLLADRTPVPLEDYGAGVIAGQPPRDVASIAARSAKSPRYARLLFRIARHYDPHYIVELGTSLGISTAYLSMASERSVVLTSEGNFVVASLAQNNLHGLGLDNVQVVTGNFDNTLPEMLSSIPHVDLAFIDGNHREQPTINYFRQLLPKLSASSMIIFDDIHWSEGMEKAWETIRQDPAVLLSIDLFVMGIVVFRPEFKVKQHFSVRF